MAKAKPKICEICGAEIIGSGHTVKIEGAELLVCNHCYERFSKKKPGTWSPMPTGREPRRRAPRPRPATPPSPRPPKPAYTEELVEDYAERVRKAIQRSGLTYEQLSHNVGLSTNLLKRIAHGDYAPTIEEARKLEKYFGIKLLESTEAPKVETASIPRDYEPTLGDVANIRVKKRKK